MITNCLLCISIVNFMNTILIFIYADHHNERWYRHTQIVTRHHKVGSAFTWLSKNNGCFIGYVMCNIFPWIDTLQIPLTWNRYNYKCFNWHVYALYVLKVLNFLSELYIILEQVNDYNTYIRTRMKYFIVQYITVFYIYFQT